MSQPVTKSMDDIVALCRRRGFIFQSSEIYGGINGFWDYGPLGAQLKRNLKDAWWHDIVQSSPNGPDAHPISMVGVDCTIIMNPKVWVASGHAAGFNDPMVDDRDTKDRFRADHIYGLYARFAGDGPIESQLRELAEWAHDSNREIAHGPQVTYVGAGASEAFGYFQGRLHKTKHAITPISVAGVDTAYEGSSHDGRRIVGMVMPVPANILKGHAGCVPSPSNREIDWLVKQIVGGKIPPVPAENPKAFPLTEPRQFNLMFQTFVGAVQNEESMAYLRPETAQGIFANFWNVVDTSRVKVPFGIAQVGKAFRNEVTPRNFTFRSREFEQMEIEFFIHPDEAVKWYQYWRNSRYAWWQSIGLAGDNLQLRDHDKEELAHYAKSGAGVCDVEYRFPFTAPGFGELEGVAHRADFDLRAHATATGKGDKLMYFDQDLQVKLQAQGLPKEEINAKAKYFPHVIEPSAGADRGTLALICEAYTPDAARPSGVYMKFHPRMAPVKAGVFPLVNKEGMPEIGEKLYTQLRRKYTVEFDEKQSIGKRYARMDEAGTPFCFTVDGDTLKDQTVTVRERDTASQTRIGIDSVEAFVAEKIGG